MRLNRKYSMTRQAEFAYTREQGQAKGGRYLVLSTASHPDLPHHKIGIITTRKIGNAVTRNRLRRRIQAILFKHIGQITGDQDKSRYLVTVLRWRAPEATLAQLEKDWLAQARKLGILNTTGTRP